MVDLIENVKHRARILQRRAQRGDEDAVQRLQGLPELRSMTAAEVASGVQRRHALSALAVCLGFQGWPQAKACLAGEPVQDRGTLMHRESGGGIWNVWSAHYPEARDIRHDHGGFLLGYRRQFVIVEEPYLEFLGLDPRDPDWEEIGRDWVCPTDREAWARLTDKAIAARLGDA